eukprot:6025537-Prorocentrum_lima.AAC.1
MSLLEALRTVKVPEKRGSRASLAKPAGNANPCRSRVAKPEGRSRRTISSHHRVRKHRRQPPAQDAFQGGPLDVI